MEAAILVTDVLSDHSICKTEAGPPTPNSLREFDPLATPNRRRTIHRCDFDKQSENQIQPCQTTPKMTRANRSVSFHISDIPSDVPTKSGRFTISKVHESRKSTSQIDDNLWPISCFETNTPNEDNDLIQLSPPTDFDDLLGF